MSTFNKMASALDVEVSAGGKILTVAKLAAGELESDFLSVNVRLAILNQILKVGPKGNVEVNGLTYHFEVLHPKE